MSQRNRVRLSHANVSGLIDGWNGRLRMWERPDDNEHYVIGVDAGKGVGRDRSVIEVLRKGTKYRPDEQVAEFACLAPQSLVRTPDGVVEIQDVRVGDRVFTHTGKLACVNATKTVHKESALEVRTGLSQVPLICTSDHLFATMEGWVEAKDLVPGHTLLRYPVRQVQDEYREPLEITYKRKPVRIQFDRAFGFFCGLYLADGCIAGRSKATTTNGITFTLHKREADPWKTRLQEIGPFNISLMNCSNTHMARRLFLSSSELAEWVDSNFGSTHTKHIPSWVWTDCPREFAEGIAEGMIAGDGSMSRTCQEVTYTSVLPALVTGLQELILGLGIGLGVISKSNRQKNGKIYRPAYKLSLCGESAKPYYIESMLRPLKQHHNKHRSSIFRWGWDKTCIYVPVKAVKSSRESEFVDINVGHPDSSFCVLQGAVHNSNHHDPISLAEIAAAIGRLYGGKDDEALAVVELNTAGGGDICQTHMRNVWGYTNLYVRKRYDAITGTWSQQLGWNTNNASRPKMVVAGSHAINSGDLIVHSPELLYEMAGFDENLWKANVRSKSGEAHDDRVMALLMAYWGAHDEEWLVGEDVARDRAAHRATSAQRLLTDPSRPSDNVPRRDFQNTAVSSDAYDRYADELAFDNYTGIVPTL